MGGDEEPNCFRQVGVVLANFDVGVPIECGGRFSSVGVYTPLHTMMLTARREIPKPPQSERVCSHCAVVEDEEHAIFNCPLYRLIRLKESYVRLLGRYQTIGEIFNPRM